MKKIVTLIAGLALLAGCSEHESPNRSLEDAYTCSINGGGKVAVLKDRNDEVSVAFVDEKNKVAKVEVQNDKNGKSIDLVFKKGTCKAKATGTEQTPALSVTCGPVRFSGLNVPEIGVQTANSAVRVNEANTATMLEVTVSGEGKLQSREVGDKYTTAGSFVVKASYLSEGGQVAGEKETFQGAEIKPQILTTCTKASKKEVSSLINQALTQKTAKN